jgi:hypothetical protein
LFQDSVLKSTAQSLQVSIVDIEFLKPHFLCFFLLIAQKRNDRETANLNTQLSHKSADDDGRSVMTDSHDQSLLPNSILKMEMKLISIEANTYF